MAIPDKLPDSVRIGGSALVQRVRYLLIHMFHRFIRNNYYFWERIFFAINAYYDVDKNTAQNLPLDSFKPMVSKAGRASRAQV